MGGGKPGSHQKALLISSFKRNDAPQFLEPLSHRGQTKSRVDSSSTATVITRFNLDAAASQLNDNPKVDGVGMFKSICCYLLHASQHRIGSLGVGYPQRLRD